MRQNFPLPAASHIALILFALMAFEMHSAYAQRRPPTMNQPQDMVLLRNSGQHTVIFTGVNDNLFFGTQTIDFQGTSSNNSVINEANFQFDYRRGSSQAEFTFLVEPNRSGLVVIQITLTDPDGSNTYSFEVLVNSPPSFAMLPSHTVVQGEGAQAVPDFAYDISDGDDDDGTQSLTFEVELDEVVSGNLSFSSFPSLSNTGALTYTANPATFGEAVFVVTLDDGQAGNNLSQEQVFSIIVEEYTNVPPTFTLSGDVEDEEDFAVTHSVTVTPDPVPGDETGQSLTYSIEPASIDFAEISFDPTSGTVLINAIADRYGVQTFTITADDGEPIDNTHSEKFTLTIHNVDDLPTMNDISDVFLPEDPDPQQLTLSGLSAGPFESEQEIISIVATSFDEAKIPHPTVQYSWPDTEAILLFTPTASAAGQTTIQVLVVDEGGLSITKTFNIFVADINDPPYFDPISSPLSIEEDAGEQYTVITGIHAGPGESQFLTFEVASDNPDLISNAAVTYSNPSANGILTFSPNPYANGMATLTITLTDDGPTGEGHQNSFNREVVVNVSPVSDAPRFISEPDTLAIRDSLYTYTIVGHDPDAGDVLTFSGDIIPPWLLLEDLGDGTALLSGTPTEDDLGIHPVSIVLQDNTGEMTWQAFNLLVEKPNNLPYFSSDPDSVAVSGVYYSYLVSANDLDEELLDFSADTKPVWLAFTDYGNGTALLEGTPPQSITGAFPISLRVEDPRGGVSEQAFELAVYRHDPELGDMEESVLTFPFGDESVQITKALKVLSRKAGLIQSAMVKFDRSTYQQGIDSIGLDKPEGITLTFDWFNGELGINGLLPAVEYEEMLRSARYYRKGGPEGDFLQRKVSFTVWYEGRVSNEVSRIIDFETDFVKLEIPTGFTPNNDMTNDVWNIRNIELYPEAVVSIYARNGKKVFEAVGYYGSEWKGQSTTGEVLPAGVYFYSINLNKFDVVYRGTVTLLK